MQDEPNEIMKEYLDRKPSPFPKLFSPHGGRNYIHIDWSARSLNAFSEAYYEAAQTYLNNLPNPFFDYQSVPLVFLYRHYVELALKDCLLNALSLAHTYDPDFTDTKTWQAIRRDHRLSFLLDELRRIMIHNNQKLAKDMDGTIDWISAQAEEFIRELDQLDPQSFCFRYPTDTKGNTALPEALGFNLEALSAGMTHIHKELSQLRDIVAIAEDQIQEYLQDLQSEVGW